MIFACIEEWVLYECDALPLRQPGGWLCAFGCARGYLRKGDAHVTVILIKIIYLLVLNASGMRVGG